MASKKRKWKSYYRQQTPPIGKRKPLHLREALTRQKMFFAGDRLLCPEGVLLFQDYGAKVLAIAHLDAVSGGEKQYPIFDGPIVRHTNLDDRLGVWAVHQLRDLGLEIDILLTDNEECGRSTAKFFVPPKQYNWMFSFDRKGMDCVLYRYDADLKWRQACGLGLGPVAQGSYSCIDHARIGACGVNIGVGYYAHNTKECWADIRQTHDQLIRFVNFFDTNKDIFYPWNTPTCAQCPAELSKWEAENTQLCWDCRRPNRHVPDHEYSGYEAYAAAICGAAGITPKEGSAPRRWDWERGCYEDEPMSIAARAAEDAAIRGAQKKEDARRVSKDDPYAGVKRVRYQEPEGKLVVINGPPPDAERLADEALCAELEARERDNRRCLQCDRFHCRCTDPVACMFCDWINGPSARYCERCYEPMSLTLDCM